MKKIVDTTNLFSSDILLFNLLKKAKSKNHILKHFSISFPSMSKLKSDKNMIFVGNGRNVWLEDTSDMSFYENQIGILIASKFTDYEQAKNAIDLGTKAIIRTIKNSELNRRGFKWTNAELVYDPPEYNIKYRRLNVSFKESYDWLVDDDCVEELDIFFEDVEVND